MRHQCFAWLLLGLLLLSACTASSYDPQNGLEGPVPPARETQRVTATKETASETQLQEDLCNSAVFHDTAANLGLGLTNFEVVKRQTTPEDKIDKVWVTADAETNTADYYYRVRGHLECVMVYGLYNEGWILDEVSSEDGSWVFTPLEGYSDAIAAEMASTEGGELLENEVDLDNRIQYITYRKTSSDRYCESEYVIQDEYIFSCGAEWRWNDRRTLDKVETWHIDANFIHPKYSADTSLFFDGVAFWWGIEHFALHELIDARNMSQEQLLLSGVSLHYLDEIERGYSVEFDNVDWSDVQYAVKGSFNALLIGKNHIYEWMSTHYSVDYSTQTIHYQFYELLPQ